MSFFQLFQYCQGSGLGTTGDFSSEQLLHDFHDVETPSVPPLTQALLTFKCPRNEATSSPGSSFLPSPGARQNKNQKKFILQLSYFPLDPTHREATFSGDFIFNRFSPLLLEPSKLVHSCALWRNRTHCQEWFVWWSPVLCFLRRCIRRWLCFLLRKSHHQLAHERKWSYRAAEIKKSFFSELVHFWACFDLMHTTKVRTHHPIFAHEIGFWRISFNFAPAENLQVVSATSSNQLPVAIDFTNRKFSVPGLKIFKLAARESNNEVSESA